MQSPADEKSRSISSSPGISVRGSTDLKADTKGSMDTIEMDDRRIRIAESKESLKPSSQPNSARSSISDQNGDPSTHRGGSQNNHKDQTGNNRSNRFDREGSKEKDDHRMATYSKSPLRSSGCATSRLHNHIRNDAPSNSSSAPPQKSSKKETLRQSEPHDAKGTDKPPESLSDCYDDDIETLNISAESSPSRSNRQRLATRNERRDRQFSTSSEDERAFVNSDTTNTPHQKYAAELEIDAETAKNHRSSLIQNNR